MKTKIITLESHDDLISVRDKLAWAKTPRILLIWPKYEKVTLRLLDLKVLQRHADSLGAQLGLVTKWNNVKRDAESLNIPVFDSTAAAQKDAWVDSPPRKRRIPLPPQVDLRKKRAEIRIKESGWASSLLGRIILFSVGVISVLVLGGLFIPHATVTLYPQAENISVVIPVQASPAFDAVSLNGNLPAQIISVTVNVEKTKALTSQIKIPTAKATGFVQFQNLSSEEVSIPAGTVVATIDSIRFSTLNRSLLPAGDAAMVEIPIQAINAGAQGNVNADEIVSIEGELGLLMTVSNPEATTGGTDVVAVGATEDERIQLREQVLEEIKQTAEVQIRALMKEKDFLLLDTMKMTKVLQEDFSPIETIASDSLTFTLQAEFIARYILAEDMQTMTLSAVSASIPSGFSPSGEMTFDLVEPPITDSADITHFQIQANQIALKEIDILQIFSLIRGNNLQEARSKLMTTFSLREEPQIQLSPAWWNWMPLIPFNISVEIK